MERRYDIDWLRVIAIGLLLIYHIGIAFQPWGIMIAFIQSDEPLSWLWTPMSLLNVWRIPFLFFVSGMGIAFALRKRNVKELLFERAKRILLPFIFGFTCIVPIHWLIFQKYYEIPLTYSPNPGHLWFLGNLVTYIICLWPIFYLLKRENKVSTVLKKAFASPLGLLIVIIAMIAEVMIVQPTVFEMYALTLHGYILGGLAFLFGYCFIHAGEQFWNMLIKWRFIFIAGAIGLYILRVMVYNLKSPEALLSIESNLWVFSILAFGRLYLNKPSRVLSYLSTGAYPIYIVHMIFLYLGSALLFKTGLNTSMQLILVTVFTFIGCLGTYEILRRIPGVKVLFGMN